MSQTRKGVRPSLVGGAFVFTPAALECGTLTSKPVRDRARQYNSHCFGGGGVEPRVGERLGPGTLLGPEASVAALFPFGVGGCSAGFQVRTRVWSRQVAGFLLPPVC